ncbi:hypothetical protein [Halosimplex sp. TS25]
MSLRWTSGDKKVPFGIRWRERSPAQPLAGVASGVSAAQPTRRYSQV